MTPHRFLEPWVPSPEVCAVRAEQQALEALLGYLWRCAVRVPAWVESCGGGPELCGGCNACLRAQYGEEP